MTNFVLSIFVFMFVTCILMDLVSNSLADNNLDIFKSHYGDGYGTEWIYFPDDNGVLHHINLTMTNNEVPPLGQLYSDIEYRLYHGHDPSYILLDKQGRAVDDSDQDITNEILRSNLPLKLVTHGWRSSADTEDMLNIKNAYVTVQNVTVIIVDWSCTANSLLYLWVANETKTIGAHIAVFLDGLNYEYNVTGDQLHLIGHSLGAHVMGIAASKTNRRVNRVTGLDPARPFFEFPPEGAFEKLDSSDAEFVDVIHTCAGLLGFEGTIGTVDFYPNEGSAPQPGCEGIFKFFEACSHRISLHYFYESIKYPTSYLAYECGSWDDFLNHRCIHTGYMGEAANRNMSGTYYLRTNASESFNFVSPVV